MIADTQYAVYRKDGKKRYLNGRFDEQEHAQKAAARVKEFHGENTVTEIVPPKRKKDEDVDDA